MDLLSGMDSDPKAAIDSVFEAVNQDPVVLSNVPFYSICEHHMLPFFGVAHIAYIPDGKIAGLSKLARALEAACRRLQVQERLTSQVAEAIDAALDPDGVAVVVEAEHLCISMRGVNKPGCRVITTAVRGRFQNPTVDRDGLVALLRRS